MDKNKEFEELKKNYFASLKKVEKLRKNISSSEDIFKSIELSNEVLKKCQLLDPQNRFISKLKGPPGFGSYLPYRGNKKGGDSYNLYINKYFYNKTFLRKQKTFFLIELQPNNRFSYPSYGGEWIYKSIIIEVISLRKMEVVFTSNGIEYTHPSSDLNYWECTQKYLRKKGGRKATEIEKIVELNKFEVDPSEALKRFEFEFSKTLDGGYNFEISD